MAVYDHADLCRFYGFYGFYGFYWFYGFYGFKMNR